MKIVCIGDSLTEGDYGVAGKRGIANVQKESYPYFLQKNTGWQIVNAGKCGYRSSHELAYLQSGTVDLEQADGFVVLLGTNGGQSAEGDCLENQAYRDLLDFCKKTSPKAKILLCTPPHVTENPSYSNCGYAKQVHEAVLFVRSVAQETGYPMLDLAKCPQLSAENEAIMQPNDGLHFSAVGYQVIAREVEKALREILQ